MKSTRTQINDIKRLFENLLWRNMLLKTSSSIDSISQSLDLTGNRLTFVSDEILAQTDLEELWVDDNQITEIPEGIDRLIRFKRFSAYKNQLKMLPDSFLI